MRRILFAALLIALPACYVVGLRRGDRPRIVEIRPDSAPADPWRATQLTIRGSGFLPEGNTVRFGAVVIPDLASAAEGTEIRFYVPREFPTVGEAAPPPLGPGEYAVTVQNRHGASNSVVVTLTWPRN
ncbi:MAG: hypothetical protein HY703_12575 [Gemmatimonadetes bacterium]|nr:hypothetical protein [Gemmatimonadota bacterium]